MKKPLPGPKQAALDRAKSKPGKAPSVSVPENAPNSPRTRRLLFCGVRDDDVLRAIKESLGEVDFASVHTTEPDEVSDYLRHFAPDYLILGSQNWGSIRTSIEVFSDATERDRRGLTLAAVITAQLKLPRTLTDKQAEVLRYLENGCSNKEIAEYMGVQPRTVKEWLTELYRIFFVSNRTELVGRLNEINRRGPLAISNDEMHQGAKQSDSVQSRNPGVQETAANRGKNDHRWGAGSPPKGDKKS